MRSRMIYEGLGRSLRLRTPHSVQPPKIACFWTPTNVRQPFLAGD